jgi:uncharacterized repeat protein (TIGR03803 family)
MHHSSRRAFALFAVVLGLSAAARGISSRSLEVLHAFTGASGTPRGDFALGPDGTLYGVTQYDGIFNGSVYSMTPDGAGGFTYRQLHAFKRDGSEGIQPQAGVILATDGYLYGTTSGAGPGVGGTIFRMDLDGNLTILHAFTGTDGSDARGALLEGGDGFFYGTTRAGGPGNFGTIFKIDAAGNFTSLHAFTSSDGRMPFGHVSRAPNGDLYGMTSRGGSDADVGTIFRLTPGGTLTTIHVFPGFPSTDGAVPQSGLTLGPDGNLYGSARGGGSFDAGVILRLTLPATVDIVHSFNSDDGALPVGEVLPDGSGALVGTTSAGGAAGMGTVYRIATGGTLTTLHSFSGPDGESPLSSATATADGSLFTAPFGGGGPTSDGAAVRVDSEGTATVVHAFVENGAGPRGALMQASDGKLYGTTGNWASLFRLESSGAVTTFALPRDPAIEGPMSALVESGDGWFYGTAPGYIYDNTGSVFRAKLDGTVETVHLFLSGTPGGVRPYGGLVRALDGNYYGTTHDLDNSVFKIDGTDNSFSVLQPLDGTSGGTPCGRLVESAPGLLSATAQTGGPNGAGTVFQVTTAGALSVLHGFPQDSPIEGAYPCSDLTLGSDGWFYGTTLAGPGSGGGTAFRLSADGTTTTTLHEFLDPGGISPLAGLAEAGGFFYGTTSQGGASNLGTLFRVDATGRFQNLYSFDDETGAAPVATLLLATDGFLYGTAREGGWWAGTLFRLSVDTPAAAVTPTSGPADTPVAIAITGSGFQPSATVSVGGAAAGNVVVQNDMHASATTPPTLTPGSLSHVRVLNPDLSSSTIIEGWLADFLDVPRSDIFHASVETIVREHIAAGYGTGLFGRNDPMTRAQMAVVLLKSEHGSGYQPQACQGVFSDVACPSQFANWIERLFAEGLTSGCGGDRYCPADPVTRAQAAVLLLKGEHGPAYVPPACTGIFADVACSPVPAFAADWIERLYAESVTGGCGIGPLTYCPGATVTRAQMAVFLVRTFGIS